MRELMMKRVRELLGPFTDDKYDQKFLSMRWKAVGAWLYAFKFGEEYLDTKLQKQFLKTAKLDDFLLSHASDEDILALFELVTRRYFTQM